jgi:hypothetical protein
MAYGQAIDSRALLPFDSEVAERRPRDIPRSGVILRRRVLEEMKRPGRDGRPLFETDVALARLVKMEQSHLSKFLHGTGDNWRGVSLETIDLFAAVFDLDIWQLFHISGEPYKWRTK